MDKFIDEDEFPGWELHIDDAVTHAIPSKEAHLHTCHVLCECAPEVQDVEENFHLWIHYQMAAV